MSLTSGRLPTNTLMDGRYNAAPVAINTKVSASMDRCRYLSAREKRGMRVWVPAIALDDGVVVTSIGRPHPRIDVVSALLPVAGNNFVDDLDPGHPLQGLVAVHRCHVQPHRTTVFAGDGLTEHAARDQDVVAQGLGHRERFGVGTVEGEEAQCRLRGVGAGGDEDIAQQHPGPGDVVDPPARDALEVLGHLGLRQPGEIVEGQRQWIGNGTGYVESVLIDGHRWVAARDGVDAKSSGGREDPTEPGSGCAYGALNGLLRRTAKGHTHRTHSQHAEHHPPADG